MMDNIHALSINAIISFITMETLEDKFMKARSQYWKDEHELGQYLTINEPIVCSVADDYYLIERVKEEGRVNKLRIKKIEVI